jgi:hypothetical protein
MWGRGGAGEARDGEGVVQDMAERVERREVPFTHLLVLLDQIGVPFPFLSLYRSDTSEVPE